MIVWDLLLFNNITKEAILKWDSGAYMTKQQSHTLVDSTYYLIDVHCFVNIISS